MFQCFISYASLDRVLAQWLADLLREHRFAAWIDVEGIRSGDQWETQIHTALEACHACVVIVTPEAVSSDWVRRELAISRTLNNPIIPLVMRPIAMSADLATLGIADVQCIDFYRYGKAQGQHDLLATLDRQRQSQPETRLRALIVEDVPAQQRDVEQVLTSLGLEVEMVGDFDDALEQIQDADARFDLVTLDMQLGEADIDGMHGRSLLFQMESRRPDTPVIIISSLDFPVSEVRDFIVESRADILQKPFNPRELRSRVQRLLKLS